MSDTRSIDVVLVVIVRDFEAAAWAWAKVPLTTEGSAFLIRGMEWTPAEDEEKAVCVKQCVAGESGYGSGRSYVPGPFVKKKFLVAERAAFPSRSVRVLARPDDAWFSGRSLHCSVLNSVHSEDAESHPGTLALRLEVTRRWKLLSAVASTCATATAKSTCKSSSAGELVDCKFTVRQRRVEQVASARLFS